MARDVLVLNTGSSSVKYQLIAMPERRRLATGLVERVGEPGPGQLTHRAGDDAPYQATERFADHARALEAMLAAFQRAGPDLDMAPLAAVGHRVVHGGSLFTEPTLLDDEVVARLGELNALAPLHNPPNLAAIEVARRAFPAVPHVAVFDTAFHQTMPPAAYTYAVPEEWRERYAVRRYGFHGTSQRYVAARATALLGRQPAETNLIVLHLGNGASACAVQAGRSVATSMGMTPLEGLVMGTRSGDVDPALPGYLHRVAGLSVDQVEHALNNDSGLLGLAGSNDVRDVWQAVRQGDAKARLATEVYCQRIRMCVGGYYALLGRVDAIVFTAGVGENDPRVRALSLSGLERIGIAVDPELNWSAEPGERRVSPPGSSVAVLVIPTDEEVEIAEQTLAAVDARAAE
jgi:acetate kinase